MLEDILLGLKSVERSAEPPLSEYPIFCSGEHQRSKFEIYLKLARLVFEMRCGLDSYSGEHGKGGDVLKL